MNNDQELRARSLEIAVQIQGHSQSKGAAYVLSTYTELATEIADYIRGYAVDESKLEVGVCPPLETDDDDL